MSRQAATEFIYMGDPRCSRIPGRENDYSRWGRPCETIMLKCIDKFAENGQ